MDKTRNKNWKDYIWTIPLLGVIITIVGILAPTTYRNSWGVEEMIWMWGLVYSYRPGYYQYLQFFTSAYEMFIPSLICFGILVIILITLLRTSIKEKRLPGTSGVTIATLGILLIGLIIGYYISMYVGYIFYFQRAFPAEWAIYQSAGVVINFWWNDIPHFGTIGPILGGICAIIGGVISKYSDKIDEKLITKELSKPKEEAQMDEEIEIQENP